MISYPLQAQCNLTNQRILHPSNSTRPIKQRYPLKTMRLCIAVHGFTTTQTRNRRLCAVMDAYKRAGQAAFCWPTSCTEPHGQGFVL